MGLSSSKGANYAALFVATAYSGSTTSSSTHRFSLSWIGSGLIARLNVPCVQAAGTFIGLCLPLPCRKRLKINPPPKTPQRAAA